MLSALIPVIVMQIGLLLGFSTFMLAVVLVHEAGHVMAGLLCGFRIISVKVGPVQFLLPHSWQFTFRRKRFLDGSVQVQFRKMPGQWARWQCFGFLFGGSLTNICAALLVLPFAIRDTAMADIFAFFILASVFLAVTQLIPFEVRGIRSDGAKLIALLFSRTKRDAFLFNSASTHAFKKSKHFLSPVNSKKHSIRQRKWPAYARATLS